MGRFKTCIGLISCIFVILCLTTYAESRLFKVLNKNNKICGMIDVNFTVTFTAFQGGRKLRAVTYTQNFYRNYVTGDCNRNLALHLDNVGTWTLHVHFKFVPDPKYMLTRTVDFVPGLVFGQSVVPSNTTQTFVNIEDSTIGPVDCSYKCAVDDKSYYRKVNSTSMYQAVSGEKEFSYSVLVDVSYIQVQVSRVHRDKFGPVVACQPAM